MIGPEGWHWRQRPLARRRAVSTVLSSLLPLYQYTRVEVRGMVAAQAAAAWARKALSSSSELDQATRGLLRGQQQLWRVLVLDCYPGA